MAMYVFDSSLSRPAIVALAERIRMSDIWILEDVKALCIAADMESEWDAAEPEETERVIEEAADRLGVKIY